MSETLRDLVVSLSLDSDNFSRNIKSVALQIKEAEAAFAAAGAGVEGFENSADGLGSKLSMLKTKMAAQKAEVDQYQGALAKANEKLAASKKSQDDTKASLEGSKKKYAEIGEQVAKYKDEVARLAEAEGDNTEQWVAASEELERLEKEYADAGEEVKGFEAKLAALPKTLQNNADAVSRAQTNLSNAEGELKKTTASIESCEKALNGLNWTKAGEGLAVFSKKAQEAGDRLNKTGKTLTRYFTTSIAALGTMALKSSIDFESAFTGVLKTVDGTEQQLESIRQGIIDMSTTIPKSTTELSALAESAGQLGIETDKVLGFTKVMADLQETTNLGDEGASQIAQFANIMKMSQDDFDKFGSTVVDLGNNFATTEADIVDMAMRLAGSGKQIGLTEAQVLGFATALSSVGIESQAGGSAFSKVMIGMQLAVETGKNGLKDYAKVAGMTAKEFQTAFKTDAAGALESFIVGLSKMDEEGISAIKTLDDMGISEVRLRDTLLRASNAEDLFTKSLKTASGAWKSNTALTKEANMRYETTESQLEILKNQATQFARTLGDEMIPTVREIMDGASDLMDGFLKLDSAQRQIIIRTGLGIAVAGPALSILGKGVSVVGKVTGAFGKLSTAVGTAGGGLSGFMAVVGSSKLAVLGLVVAGGALVWNLFDIASGARAAREAMEGMNATANDWKNMQADSLYDTGNDPFARFNIDKESFAGGTKASKDWLASLIKTWTDGEKETNEIVASFVDSFAEQSDKIRMVISERQEALSNTGIVAPESEKKMQDDLKQLDEWDKEIATLLKKRQNGLLSEKEQTRLDEVIKVRGELQLEYSVEESDGYKQILQGVEAELARLEQLGIKVESSLYSDLYGDALKAAAQGNAAQLEAINGEYESQYTLINQTLEGEERKTALGQLNAQYAEQRANATEEYAATLKDLTPGALDTKEIKQGQEDFEKLNKLVKEYHDAKGDSSSQQDIIGQMNEAFAGMDEGAIVSYISLLAQIQDVANSGGDPNAILPDATETLEQLGGIKDFVADVESQLPGLAALFSEALPQEVQRIMVELDRTVADEQWAQFKEDTSAITTAVTIDRIVNSETTPEISALANFIGFNPLESAALLDAYAKFIGYRPPEGEDVSLEALATFVGYNPLDDPALLYALAQFVGYKPKEGEKATLDAIANFVGFTPQNDEDVTLEALAAFVGYDPMEDPATLDAFAQFLGYDPMADTAILDAIAAFVGYEPEEGTDVSLDAIATFIGYTPPEKEFEIAVTAKVTDIQYPPPPEIEIKPGQTGSPEVIEKVLGDVKEPLGFKGWGTSIEERMQNITKAAKDMEEAMTSGGAAGYDTIEYAANSIEAMTSLGGMDTIIQFIGDYNAALKNNEAISEDAHTAMLDVLEFFRALSAFGSTSTELAIFDVGKNLFDENWLGGTEDVMAALEVLGKDAAAGLGQGAREYDFTADTDAMSNNFETSGRASFASQSPAQKMVPLGNDVSAGIGQGAREYDFSGDSSVVAASFEAALKTSLPPDILKSIGTNAMSGMALGILSGRAGVVSAIRSVARDAVKAAKEELQINSPSRVFEDEVGRMMTKGMGAGALAESRNQQKVIANAARYLTDSARDSVYAGISSDNRRSYQNDNSVSVSVNEMVVRDQQDVHSLALEMAQLNRRRQFGYGGRRR